jgi:hypothetical protein
MQLKIAPEPDDESAMEEIQSRWNSASENMDSMGPGLLRKTQGEHLSLEVRPQVSCLFLW